MNPQKVIIIGASSGIGRELALLFAASGATVGITGRREECLNEVSSHYPAALHSSAFDVREPDAIQKLESLITTIGGLDLLVYAAGFGHPSTHLDPAAEGETTAVNVSAMVPLVAFAFNLLCGQGKGQIALISSLAALRGNGWAPAYSASKAFTSTYAEGLNIKARKLQKEVVITDIRPGFVDTKMAKGPGRFWVAPPRKAAIQIKSAITSRKRVAYITKRWWIIAQLMKAVPFTLYRRLA